MNLYEQRFAELKPLLPDRGVVGYVSDTGTQHFFETQYVLAPVLLTRSPGPKAILANFSRDSARPILLYGRPYRILRDWHNGVAWLTQDSP